MAALNIDDIAASTVFIYGTDTRGDRKSGTGYVVASGIVATCDHVVRDMLDGEPLMLRFDDGTEARATRLSPSDPELDSALLSFNRDDGGPPALVLGGECTWKANFDCWGFSTYASGQGLSLRGIVGRASITDDQGRRAIELDCDQAYAANGTPMHGFSGSPVLVDGLVIGHVKRFLSDPADKMRPAFGKIYATPSASVHALLKQFHAATASNGLPQMDIPPSDSAAARADIEKLKAMLDSSRAERAAKEAFELQAAESLIQLGSPSDAIQALERLPSSLRRDQLMALSLAKTGTKEGLDKAFRLLEELGTLGHRDVETAGILGGRYKDLWRETGIREHLEKSHATYLSAFKTNPDDPYPGINAAATALWLGERDLSQRVARDVLALLQARPRSARDCWHHATEAEARLLLGEREAARALYRKACESCDYAPGILLTIGRQLNQHEEVLGLERTHLTRS